MSQVEVYQMTCVCALAVEIPANGLPVCPNCGRPFFIEWEQGRAEIAATVELRPVPVSTTEGGAV
jgi:hypothetical protein